jgi:hypothetical protein
MHALVNFDILLDSIFFSPIFDVRPTEEPKGNCRLLRQFGPFLKSQRREKVV